MDAFNPLLRLPVLRYCGLVGAALLAVSSVTVRHRPVAIPLWFVGTVLIGGAWLLLGRRLTGVGLRWLLVTAALWAVPLLLSAPLASRDAYAYACQGSLVTGGIDPYAHGIAALPCPWLHEVPSIWWQTPSPYGPLWLVITGAAAATGSLLGAIAVVKLVALAGIGLLGWAGHRLARTLGVDPVPAAWLGILCPLVLLHALAGAHNDALLAGLVVSALAWAVAGERTIVRAVGVGVLLGLAVAVKASALVALPFVVLLAARDRGWLAILRAGLATGLGAVGAYGALWATTGYGLGWLPALRHTTERIVEATSIPTGVGMVVAHGLKLIGLEEPSHQALDWVRGVGLLVLVVVLAMLWFWARRRGAARDIVLATGLGLAASVILGPVAFPWYALAPLGVLAYSIVEHRWRYRLGIVAAAATLLILPSGNGFASMYRKPGGVLDTLLVLALVLLGLRYLHRRRTGDRVPVEVR